MWRGSGYSSHDYGVAPAQPGSGGGGRRSRRGLSVLTHLAVAAVAAGAAVGVTLGVDHPASSAGPALPGTALPGALPGATAVPTPPASPSAGPVSGLQQVVNKVEPGLVVINTTQQYNSEAAAGTGMVINPDGLVLTNNHVIAGATKMTATAVATGKTYPATVVGYDKSGDIALIKLQGATGLKTVPVGNSATVKTGDSVVALGNAEGQGAAIPAAGRVTALNQTITASDQGGTASSETLHGMIQTSAHIVSGDSGGPLANAAGQVIGMDTAGNSVSLTDQQAAEGFAIPINTALAVARQIAAGHASSTITVGYPPFLGLFTGSGSSADPQVQAQEQEQSSAFGDGFGGFGGFNGFGFGTGIPASPACYTSNSGLAVPAEIAPASSGTLVDGVICGGPAAVAGITGGSVITEVNGQPAGSPDHFSSILARYRPGDTLSLTWVSPTGQRATSDVKLAAGPPQ